MLLFRGRRASQLTLFKAKLTLGRKLHFVPLNPLMEHHLIAAPKSYPSFTSNTDLQYSIDSILNPQPWYNDFVPEDPPEDTYYTLSSEILPPEPSTKITGDSKEGTCEEEGFADKTSLELIQEINEVNRNDLRASLTDSEISYPTRRPKQVETDSDGIQKLSVSDNQIGCVGRFGPRNLSPKALRLKRELKNWLLKAAPNEFDDNNISKENKRASTSTDESEHTTAQAEPIHFLDKAKRDRYLALFKPWKRTLYYKPPGTVNIIENNIRIRRTKDRKGFRVKLVSPNTTIGGGIAMTTANNSVTMGARTCVTMPTKQAVSKGLEPVTYDMSSRELCQEYDLTETILKAVVSSQRGYINLTRKIDEV